MQNGKGGGGKIPLPPGPCPPGQGLPQRVALPRAGIVLQGLVLQDYVIRKGVDCPGDCVGVEGSDGFFVGIGGTMPSFMYGSIRWMRIDLRVFFMFLGPGGEVNRLCDV